MTTQTQTPAITVNHQLNGWSIASMAIAYKNVNAVLSCEYERTTKELHYYLEADHQRFINGDIPASFSGRMYELKIQLFTDLTTFKSYTVKVDKNSNNREYSVNRGNSSVKVIAVYNSITDGYNEEKYEFTDSSLSFAVELITQIKENNGIFNKIFLDNSGYMYERGY